MDTQFPEVSHQISGTLGENGWYTSNVQVGVSESDPAPSSGTQFFQTSLDGVGWTDYTAPLDFVEGTYVLQMRVIDNADNQDLNGIALNVDTTAPSIQGTITGEFGENNFYNTAIEASVSVSDGTSGIARTEYSLDGSAWLLYPGPLTIDDGLHKLQFRTKDVAGNYSYTQVYEFEVDTRGPNIKLPSRWYIWETGGLFVKDETSKIRNVTYEIRDGQNRWKKVERNWDPNRHEFTRDLDWNRIFGDGVRAPIGTYLVTIHAEDYAGNTSKKTAEIIIPAPNATPLPTFTPTPIPTNTPVPTEPADDNPTTMLPTVTSTPFVFTAFIPPSAEEGNTSSTFGDDPQTPKEPLNANGLLAVTAAAVTGAFIATQRKKETLTLEEEKADVGEIANDGILQGSAAAATIAAFKAENEERMRREAAAAAARRADRKEKEARREAEKAGRLDQYKRKKQEGREAVARAEEERLRQKDEDRRAEKKREQSGLTGKELREKEAQQAIWDANGAAIWAMKQTTAAPKVEARPSEQSDGLTNLKTFGELTPWEIEVGGRIARAAHFLSTGPHYFEFWGDSTFEINSTPPWAVLNTDKPIPMLYHQLGGRDRTGWMRFNSNGSVGSEYDPNPNRWIGENVLTSTREGAMSITDVLERTENKIPFVCGDVPDWAYYAAGHNLQNEVQLIDATGKKYPNTRWPRASYAWIDTLYQPEHVGNTHTLNMQDVDGKFQFSNEDMPELGDVIVYHYGHQVPDIAKILETQQLPSGGEHERYNSANYLAGANHVVVVAEIHGNTLDQILVVEGNTANDTTVKHSLSESLKEAQVEDEINHLIYGHPNLPGVTP